jgi:integrase/recombinase XerD
MIGRIICIDVVTKIHPFHSRNGQVLAVFYLWCTVLNKMRHFVYSVNTISPAASSHKKETGFVSFLFDREGNRKYLTAIERTAFLSAADKCSAEVRNFCRLLAYTGARISEILALTPNQIDISAGVIIIECLKKRRRGVFRALPIPQALLTELDQVHGIREAQSDPARATKRIWNWCRTTAWHQIKTCMEEAEISGHQATPKGLRHGFGVAVLQAGVPINLLKKWLGHSRLSTTEIYADAVGAEEQAIAGRFWQTFERQSC